MKIAFTTSGEDLSAPLDSRFGRACRFLIYDMEQGSFEIINNEKNLNAAQGAGVQAAETVARSGVESVVTGHCGPKAYRVLDAAGIRVYTSAAGTVAEALKALQEGKLKQCDSADVQGHW